LPAEVAVGAVVVVQLQQDLADWAEVVLVRQLMEVPQELTEQQALVVGVVLEVLL
jgi:hypothetical protein